MKIALAGYGSAGQRHAASMEALGATMLLHDPDQLPSCHDWRTALDSAEGAIIASPPAAHFRQAVRAIMKRVPVLIEKPACTTAQQCTVLRQLSRRAKVPVMIGYNWRFDPEWQRLHPALATYTYHLTAISASNLARWRVGQQPTDGYAPWKRLGGGILLDASHTLDQVLQVYPVIRSVQAMLTRFKWAFGTGDTSARATILLRAASGETATVHLDYVSSVQERAIVGLARSSGGAYPRETFTWHWREESDEDRKRLTLSYERQAAAFAALVIDHHQGRGRLACERGATLTESLAVLRLIGAIERAARTGRTVTLRRERTHA